MNKAWLQIRRPFYAGLTAGLLAALLTLALPNQYKAEARCLASEQRVGGGGLGGLNAIATNLGVTIPGQESADSTYVDILNSRSLREALLETRFNFKIRTWYFGAERVREQTLYEYLEMKNLDRAVEALKGRITITRDLKTKLLTIAVVTPSPQLSQQTAQRLVQLLDEFVVTKSRTRGSVKAAFSEKRLMEARVEMSQAENTFRAFLDLNHNYLHSSDPAVMLKGLRLENELKLRTQLVTTLALAREQALLEEKNDMPILNVLDPGNLPIEKSGPARSVLALLVALLVGTGFWVWLKREWVRLRFLGIGEKLPPIIKENS